MNKFKYSFNEYDDTKIPMYFAVVESEVFPEIYLTEQLNHVFNIDYVEMTKKYKVENGDNEISFYSENDVCSVLQKLQEIENKNSEWFKEEDITFDFISLLNIDNSNLNIVKVLRNNHYGILTLILEEPNIQFKFYWDIKNKELINTECRDEFFLYSKIYKEIDKKHDILLDKLKNLDKTLLIN